MILTPAQAAKQLGVGLPYIYTLLASGKLEGERVDGRWKIPQSQVDAWRKHVDGRRKSHQSDNETTASTSASVACD